jgi:chaperonin GroEL
MQDIALYVGSKLFLSGSDITEVKTDDSYFGSAERVVVTQDKAIVFRGKGDADAITTRAAEIRDTMLKETSSHRKDTLEQRFSKLTGKIAIVNVGGSTPTEMEELRYRVEDAIEATKSAMADGVLVGGATMLVKASQLDINPLFKNALLDTFRKLMSNAAEPADYRLEQIRRAKDGYGFNLRDMSEEPVDLRSQGIWDATRAVVQTIENATSAAGSLLTVGAIIDPIDQKDEHEEA